MPESGPESRAHEADSGASMPEPLASYDPATSSWRTSQLSLDGGLTEFSETWPRSGTMRNGKCFPPPMSERPTSGNDSGLWPTPNASMNGYGADPEKWEARRQELAKKYGNNGLGMPLGIAVKLWPTPKSSPSGPDYARAGRDGSGGDDLATAVARWPTPKLRGLCGGSGSKAMIDRRTDLTETETASMTSGNGGQLNPTWVEWLMGYPLGWTDLRDSATPLSPNAPSSSSKRSRKPKNDELQPPDGWGPVPQGRTT